MKTPPSRTRAARTRRGWTQAGLELRTTAARALSALAEGRSPSAELAALEADLVQLAASNRPSRGAVVARLLLLAGELLADEELLDAVEQRHASPASGNASLATVVRQLVRAGLGATASAATLTLTGRIHGESAELRRVAASSAESRVILSPDSKK